MNRRQFIKSAAIGIGTATVPLVARAKQDVSLMELGFQDRQDRWDRFRWNSKPGYHKVGRRCYMNWQPVTREVTGNEAWRRALGESDK